MFFKEIYSGVYPKRSNSWIHSTYFKPIFTYTHFPMWD